MPGCYRLQKSGFTRIVRASQYNGIFEFKGLILELLEELQLYFFNHVETIFILMIY